MSKPFEMTVVEGFKPMKPGWHKRALARERAAEKKRGYPAARPGSYEASAKAQDYAVWIAQRDGIALPDDASVRVQFEAIEGVRRPRFVVWSVKGADDVRIDLPHWDYVAPPVVEVTDGGPEGPASGGDVSAPDVALEPPPFIQNEMELAQTAPNTPPVVIQTPPEAKDHDMPICSPIIVGDGTALIPLTRGKSAIVDVSDIALLLHRVWCAVPNRFGFYAVTPRGERMHHIIIGARPGETVNHRDRDGVNNRRANLRIRARGLNNLIRIETAGELPRGVKATRNGRFEARAQLKAGYRHLGTFDTLEEASAVYYAAMRDLYGEWAPLPPPVTNATPPSV